MHIYPWCQPPSFDCGVELIIRIFTNICKVNKFKLVNEDNNHSHYLLVDEVNYHSHCRYESSAITFVAHLARLPTI